MYHSFEDDDSKRRQHLASMPVQTPSRAGHDSSYIFLGCTNYRQLDGNHAGLMLAVSSLGVSSRCGIPPVASSNSQHLLTVLCDTQNDTAAGERWRWHAGGHCGTACW